MFLLSQELVWLPNKIHVHVQYMSRIPLQICNRSVQVISPLKHENCCSLPILWGFINFLSDKFSFSVKTWLLGDANERKEMKYWSESIWGDEKLWLSASTSGRSFANNVGSTPFFPVRSLWFFCHNQMILKKILFWMFCFQNYQTYVHVNNSFKSCLKWLGITY